MKKITLSGSKSISNRVLIINALYKNILEFQNLSNAEDTVLLYQALAQKEEYIDIHHAGTAMRFLTAFLSIQDGREVLLTGSDRMKQRPIGLLVNALRELGADIEYTANDGYPPLLIKGKKLKGSTIEIDGSVSSQFLSALVLIGSKLPNGLEIKTKGKLVSLPYLQMTLKIQNELGIPSYIENSVIKVPFVEKINPQTYTVESDWSSASYLYEMLVFSKENEAEIQSLHNNSLQADAITAVLFEENFGIQTNYEKDTIRLEKIPNFEFPKLISINCIDFPDIAQTLCMTAVGLQIPITLEGLDTLGIKETDRILALKTELNNWNIEVQNTENSLNILEYSHFSIPENSKVKTYNDHRMAMSFAPLLQKYDFRIENPEVVQKSYPEFWNDFAQFEPNYTP